MPPYPVTDFSSLSLVIVTVVSAGASCNAGSLAEGFLAVVGVDDLHVKGDGCTTDILD